MAVFADSYDVQCIRQKYMGSQSPLEEKPGIPDDLEAETLKVQDIAWKYLNPARETSAKPTNQTKKVSFVDEVPEFSSAYRDSGDRLLDTFHIIDSLKGNLEKYRRSTSPVYYPSFIEDKHTDYRDFLPTRTSIQILKEKRKMIDDPMRELKNPARKPHWYNQTLDNQRPAAFRVMTEAEVAKAIRDRFNRAELAAAKEKFARETATLKEEAERLAAASALQSLKAAYHGDIRKVEPNDCAREKSRERGLYSKVIAQICLRGLDQKESYNMTRSIDESFLPKEIKTTTERLPQEKLSSIPVAYQSPKKVSDFKALVVPIPVKAQQVEESSLNYSYSKEGSDGKELRRSRSMSRRHMPSDLMSILDCTTNMEISKYTIRGEDRLLTDRSRSRAS